MAGPSTVRIAGPILALAVVAVALVLWAPDADTVEPTSSEAAAPTFYEDVQPILAESCVSCHQPRGANLGGMVAPVAFTSYEEARAWAPMIANAVADGRMPPWDAAPEFRGVFRGERWLDDDEKATLIAWAEAGAPKGEARETSPEPEAPAQAEEERWLIGEPDLVFGFDEPFLVEDHMHDYQPTVPVHISAEDHPEPRWIRRAQLLPGSDVVHHILAWPLAAIAPGVPPVDYEEGFGVLLPEGPLTVNFNMHYNKTPGPGTAVEDLSRGAAVFYEDGAVIRHVVQKEPLGIFDFIIPAGDPDYAASRDYNFEEDSYILNFLPHMHLRGKAARFEITYPDGEHEILLDIPRYRFDWQHQYNFKDPVFAPEGTTLTMTFWWDNSASNPHNPDPTQNVGWGGATWDEMAYGFMDFVRAEPIHHVVGDPIPDDIPPHIASPLTPSVEDLPAELIRQLREQGASDEQLRELLERQGH